MNIVPSSPVRRCLFIIVAAMFFALLLSSCSKSTIPAELVGAWTGTNTVTFMSPHKGNDVFVTQQIPVKMTIKADETMEGTIGAATFVDCRIGRNSGWLVRLAGMGSDFQITTGILRGRISERDPFSRKEIMTPFDLKDGAIRGKVILRNDDGKHFLVNLDLRKEN